MAIVLRCLGYPHLPGSRRGFQPWRLLPRTKHTPCDTMTALPSGQTPERWSFKSELPWGLGAAQPSPLSPRPCGFNPDFSLSWVPGVCGAPNPLLLPAPTGFMAHISNLLPDVTRASFLPWGDVHSTSCRNRGASNETTNLSSLPSKGHCVPPCRPSETQASLTASPNSSCGRPRGRDLRGPSCPWCVSALCPANPTPGRKRF